MRDEIEKGGKLQKEHLFIVKKIEDNIVFWFVRSGLLNKLENRSGLLRKFETIFVILFCYINKVLLVPLISSSYAKRPPLSLT